MTDAIRIEPATPSDLAGLPALERRAAALFPPDVLPPGLAAETTSIEAFARACAEERLLVARIGTGGAAPASVAGFALLARLDSGPHLEELDVDPPYGRRGIGRKLVEAACDRARAEGAVSISLSTFRDVPWNAPFYARLGFQTIAAEALPPALVALREAERASGFDLDARVVMRRGLRDSD